jgi:hypothetical protein
VADSTPADAGTENEFAGLGADYDESSDLVEFDAAPAVEGEQKSPTNVEPPKQAAPASTEKPPAEAKPEKPAEAAPAVKEEPGPKEAPAQAQASIPSEPKDIIAQLSQHRDAVLSALAEQKFALSPKEAADLTQGLDADATGTILKWAPQLASRIYYEAVTATLQHINQFVPRMVDQQVANARKQEEAEKAFFSAFPAIDRTKHGNDVMMFATLARQQNPQISDEELRKFVGAAVMAKHGLTAITPPAAAMAARPNGVQQPPFVPARPGMSTTVVKDDANPWLGLGGDYD